MPIIIWGLWGSCMVIKRVKRLEGPPKRLVMFYADKCEKSKKMHPVVDRLEREIGQLVERLEVMHNMENALEMRNYADEITDLCNGELETPAFVNEKTGKILVGIVPFEALLKWATGEDE